MQRKRKILKAIIQTYLETGEPVGSRTISKYTDLNLSSATIRNEMSDLEDLGYIVQPHTSAGRIPSDLGYRLYVDELMKEKDQEVSEMKEIMIEKTDRMERVLKQVVKVLASNTNYATLITGPTYHHNKVKFIQLSKLNEEQLLAVIVVEGNLVKNQIVNLDETIDDEQILKLNLLLNTQLRPDDRRDQSWHDHEAERTGRCPQRRGKYRIRCGGRCHCSGLMRKFRCTQAERPTSSSIRNWQTAVKPAS